MDLHQIAKRAEKLLADNSPVILTAMAVTGSLTTAYLTGKASFKAADILRRNHEAKARVNGLDYQEPTFKQDFQLLWKLYIPAMGSGLLTISCIVGANRIGMRRAAAMASAYSLSEKAWGEYKDKVVEKMGERKEQGVRDEVAQDRVNRNPVSGREIIITGNGEVLCCDSITGRYFESNVESLRKAQNDMNKKIIHDMYATLSDFYDYIKLPTTPFSNEVGWNSDNLLELNFSTVLAEDGRPCISLDYATFPIRDYHRLH